MVLDNDTRGLIMTVISGVACTFGASIICVDIIIRQLPGKRNFKIEDSNTFLSMGLSLSFGVMIFSSLYSMLPSSKRYLIKGGMSPKVATLTMIGFFMLGALGISVLSRILHKYIPHKVVDCDHKHGDEEGKLDGETEHSHHPIQDLPRDVSHADEEGLRSYGTNNENSNPRGPVRRPSLHNTISSKVTQLVTGAQKLCDENGQCYGYSDTCGTECFKNALQTRPTRLSSTKSTSNLASAHLTGLSRTQTAQSTHDRRPLLDDVDETTPLVSRTATTESSVASALPTNGFSHAPNHEVPPLHKHSRTSSTSSSSSHSSHASHSHSHSHNPPSQHHHHVPTNVFLSIGLQTSTAIALHKIPEGFITYATNHASPTLGLSVFLALFIHNITEGFAMALPLYLALSSRWKAMAWSAALGGVSQPLGAGVAALWFRVAGRRGAGEDGGQDGGEVLYGCMFAVTAGVMAMVSLQLLGESLDLTHSRRVCFVSAFVGMGVLGLSSALTA